MKPCSLSDMVVNTHLTLHRLNSFFLFCYHHDSVQRRRRCSCGRFHSLTLNNVPSVDKGRKREASVTPERGLTQTFPMASRGETASWAASDKLKPRFSQGEPGGDANQRRGDYFVLLLFTSQ